MTVDALLEKYIVAAKVPILAAARRAALRSRIALVGIATREHGLPARLQRIAALE
jgi:hypothetical protein